MAVANTSSTRTRAPVPDCAQGPLIAHVCSRAKPMQYDPMMEDLLKKAARRQVSEKDIIHEAPKDTNTFNTWYGKNPSNNQPSLLQPSVSEKDIVHEAPKDTNTFNIWYGKTPCSGDRNEGRGRGLEAMVRSKYRCVPQLDCGRTRGSDANQHVFCIYFCKGCCAQGSACPYLHRIPNAADEKHSATDFGADLFGQEKRMEENGFVKGAGTLERDIRTLYALYEGSHGTLERDNRTLYVLYEGAGSYDVPKIRQLIESNFSVWGKIKNIYIVHAKTLAFVTYEWRTSAEFAKEAMHKQGLQGSTQKEVLTTSVFCLLTP
eukprot:gene22793-29961_t